MPLLIALACAAVLLGPPPAHAAVAPAVRPVPGDVARGFAPPETPYGVGHRGVDLAAVPGEAVRVALDGVVAFSGTVAGVGWVSVDHGDGLRTTYGPIDPRLVRAGEPVTAGGVLGRLAAGASHLDWGARRSGTYVDPLSLLGRWRVRLVALDEPPPGPQAAPGHPGGPTSGALAWPVRGRLSSRFGPRVHPVSGARRLHTGIDLAAPTGTPVRSAAAGVVIGAGDRGGYGLTVDLEHAGGMVTRYAHLSRIDVRPGGSVPAGQVLGAVGSTGTSTGPHLHFEVRVAGLPTDPLRWLPPH